MKYYNAIFDIFLFESIFAFIFGFILSHLNDPLSNSLIPIAVVSLVIAVLMGIAGRAFKLFKKIDLASDV